MTTEQNGQGKAAAMELGDDGLYVMRNQGDVLRVARGLLATKAVPSSLQNEQQVAMAVQSLKSLGLNPYASIRQCGFVNGQFMLYGDLPLAIVRASGLLESIEEFYFCMGEDKKYLRQCFAESNSHLEPFGAVTRVRRQGHGVHEIVFTKTQAQNAGLWGKGGPWRQYPARMLQLRARSQALKDTFSDVMAGVSIQEFDGEQGADYESSSGRRAPRQVDIEDVPSTAKTLPTPPPVAAEERELGVAALTARLRAGER